MGSAASETRHKKKWDSVIRAALGLGDKLHRARGADGARNRHVPVTGEAVCSPGQVQEKSGRSS